MGLIVTRAAFCAWPTVFSSAHTLGFTFCSINGRERAGSICMKTEAWTLLSIFLPRKGEGDPGQQYPKQRDPHQRIKDAEETPSICAQGCVAIAWAEGPCSRSRGYLVHTHTPPSSPCTFPHEKAQPPLAPSPCPIPSPTDGCDDGA